MASLSANAFKVEVADPSSSSSRAARRVVLSVEILRACKISTGDVVRISSINEPLDKLNAPFALGIVWPSSEISQTAVRLSSHTILTAQLSEGSEARIVPLPSGDKPRKSCILTLRDVVDAAKVHLKEIPHPERKVPMPIQKYGQKNDVESKRQNWLSLLVRDRLVDLKFITSFQIVDVLYEGFPRRFCFKTASTNVADSMSDVVNGVKQISLINNVSTVPTAWTVKLETVVLVDPIDKEVKGETHLMQEKKPSAYSSIGGLDKQITQIRDLIETPLTRPDLFHHFGLKPPRGILLYGPPGTGKTHLAKAIAASTNSSSLAISGASLASAYHGESEAKLRDLFCEARQNSPCVLIIDEVDALCPRREEGAGGEVEKRVVTTLLTEMDGVGEHAGERVVVIATTNRPNAIDPALRRPGRFDREIEIGIPDAHARLAILKVLLSGTPHSFTEADLQYLAARTHGYVGADLAAVVRDAGTLAIKRFLSSPQSTLTVLTLSDLSCSLESIRPSALREVFVETPHVLWSDIGGQQVVKQKLKESVEWPLLYSATFERLGVTPPKGVLLYGPPGCSKTLTAKALATESGINFIAVKGPELLNKFVGESERAVRETFRKARASAPTIVFFDEIDALATSRNSDGIGNHDGMLTTLLNEMDGIQEMTGVTVVAATNRPDTLDSALMRPGRLDRILYVGPPDQQGREEILQIRTRKMAVDPELDLKLIASMTDGCSGAEIAALCQDAALLTMQRDMDAPCVTREDFYNSAKNIRKQITSEMLEYFTSWRKKSGLRDA